MVNASVIPVVLCGGSGSRLWPLSRDGYPKQFLSMTGDESMLQATVSRLPAGVQPPMVICGENHRFLVAEQLRQHSVENSGILLEPAGRNTAPAIAVAAFNALNNVEVDDVPVLLVLPADHLIADPKAFQRAVDQAMPMAQAGNLVTFGVVPHCPETGYGYIKRGAANGVAFDVEEFVEKPNLKLAEQYLQSGDYYWNSGMFLFRADRYLQELEKHQTAIFDACKKAVEKSTRDLDFLRVDKTAFLSSPSDSIDYAVMEKSSDILTVPLDCGWSDLGSWSALWDVSKKDPEGNSSDGAALFHNSSDCLVRSGEKRVAVIGLDDIVVVDTVDATLVASKKHTQEVKAVVDSLKRNGDACLENHRKVYRPWGNYDSVDAGERFQVKRIVVNPGAELSLQMHHHRAEHWIVVKGTAMVTKGEEELLVTENQSTLIPLGVKHRLKNPGEIPLEIIEVQSGSYLGEDDIVRFEDHYGRAGAEDAE